MADLTERWLNMPSNQDVQNRVDVIDAHNIVGLYLDAKHTHNVVWLRNAQAAVNRMKSRLHAIYGNAA